MTSYYLKLFDYPETEVTREEFVRAEHSCGFYSKLGSGHVATSGFSNGVLKGRLQMSEETPEENVRCGPSPSR